MSGLIVWKKQEMDRLRKDMDRLIERLRDDFCVPFFPRISIEIPSFDLQEGDDSLVLRAEIPGLTPEDLEVSVTDDNLIIKGDLTQETLSEENDLDRSESRHGCFSRTFQLPCKILVDGVKASYKDDVLTIVMPKWKAESPRGIKIKVT
jgi:HSP20 family protein